MSNNTNNLAADEPDQQKASLTRAMKLGVLPIMLSLIIIDAFTTTVKVVLTEIEATYDADITELLWVVNSFYIVYAVLLVTSGRLADRMGRRFIFFIGAAIFGLVSFPAGFSPNIFVLIGALAVMGVGAVLMNPALVGMAYTTLPESRAGLAGGLIMGSIGLSTTFSPIFGGLLTDLLSWRWVFFINLPLMALAAFLAWRFLPADKPDDTQEKIDYLGTITLAAGILGILLALDQAANWGWGDPRILGSKPIPDSKALNPRNLWKNWGK